MEQQDEFGAATSAVGRPQYSSKAQVAEVIYEKREYPDCPEGTYTAICVKAESKKKAMDAQFNPGEDQIHHRWEILTDARSGQAVTYTDKNDEDKKVRHYQVFGKALNLSFGERANLHKLMKELTGIPPLVTKKTEARPLQGTTKTRMVTVARFDYSVLEYMTCELKIKHEDYQSRDGETRTAVNIVSYDCSPAMKFANWSQLPQSHPDMHAFPGWAEAKAAFDTSHLPMQQLPVSPQPQQQSQQPQPQFQPYPNPPAPGQPVQTIAQPIDPSRISPSVQAWNDEKAKQNAFPQ